MQRCLENDFEGKYFKITLSADGEQLRIYYPSLVEQSDDYLQSNLLNANFKLLPNEVERKQLHHDFTKIQNSMMFYENDLSFDGIMEILHKLELEINEVTINS